MKKTITFVAALLLCVGAFAESYTLNFVECSSETSDSSDVYSKGNNATEYIKNVFGETTYIASIDTRDAIYPARKGCGAKFGGETKAGFIAFTLANPTEVDSIVISAAKYGNTEGADGFKVFIVNQKDTVFFTLSAGKREFENCVWKPAGEVTTIRINQTTAAKQRFYVKSITIYPKKAVVTAIEQTTESDGSKKVLRNGQVVILREGKAYNLFGQEIAD